MIVFVLVELLASLALLWVGANVIRFILISCGGASDGSIGGFFKLSDNWVEQGKNK